MIPSFLFERIYAEQTFLCSLHHFSEDETNVDQPEDEETEIEESDRWVSAMCGIMFTELAIIDIQMRVKLYALLIQVG